MIRHLLIFTVAFALGALAMVLVRAAGHRPVPSMETAAMAAPVPPAHDHAAMAATAAATPAATPIATPVNTICPGCGGAVDPEIPTAMYQGKVIGFNCAMCLPRFKAEPQKYGEAALKNQEAK